MSALEIPRSLLSDVHSHACESYPEECCGVLLGRAEGEAIRIVEIRAAENVREAESRHNRFLIPPEVILKAQREGRQRGLDIIGYYHSHPDHPAVPSEFDREHAWPGTSYIIVSVRQGAVAETRSWRLRDSREQFDEERLAELERA